MLSFQPGYYDFFAGAGLVRLGLQSWNCLWANDIDPKKAAIHIENFGGDALQLDDIRNVSARELPVGGSLAWASFPCQDLSLAGARQGLSARRSGTFWEFSRILGELQREGGRPPLVCLENVTGLLYGDNLSDLCDALVDLGYQFGALVIDAKQFVPQSRPRVFIIAVDAGIEVQNYCNSLPGESEWLPRSLMKAWARLSEAAARRWRWWDLPLPTREVPRVEDVIERQPSGVEWHSPETTEKLLGMMTELNLQKVEDAKARQRLSVGLLYKRTRGGVQRAEVRFDGVAGCLRTPEGGSSRQTVLIVESGSVRSRLLSPREAARLMGVPDSYRLPERYNEAYKAMGDGVAVPVVDWLSRHLLLPLESSIRAARQPHLADATGTMAGASTAREFAYC